jgi:hypothetical protein
MKNKKPNATKIWKHIEDSLVPRLRLSIIDRAVYSHLLRHSRLEGKAWLRFSIAWLARGAGLSANPARRAVRRLIGRGALRLLQRNETGHVVEVRLPDEIRAIQRMRARRGAQPRPRGMDFEEDFVRSRALRRALHVRERTLFLLPASAYTADSLSRSRCATGLLREQFLSQSRLLLFAVQLSEKGPPRRGLPALALPPAPPDRRRTHARLRALDALASGKLPPPLVYPEPRGERFLRGATTANPLRRTGRPPLPPSNP